MADNFYSLSSVLSGSGGSDADNESDSASVSSAKYTPEKLIDLKVDKNGKQLFLVKWNDYPDEENTWETESNLSCTSMMEAMVLEKKTGKKTEKKCRKYKIAKRHGKLKQSDTIVKRTEYKLVEYGQRITGFNLGFTPDVIVGAIKIRGQMEFLMRWKEDERIDLIPRLVANEKCPKLVIKYYEQNMFW